MNEQYAADQDTERSRSVSWRTVGLVAALGFNLVLIAWSLYRIPLHAPSAEVLIASSDNAAFMGFLYCVVAVVAVGHLWFLARMMRLAGVAWLVPTLLLGIGASLVLVFGAGALLWLLLEPTPRSVVDALVFPVMGAVGFALAARLTPHYGGSHEAAGKAPVEPRTTSGRTIGVAAMLGVNFTLVAWSSLMFWAMSFLALGTSPRQEPTALVVLIYCVLAVVAVFQVWFLIRMLRLGGVARPAPTLLLGVGTSVALSLVVIVVLLLLLPFLVLALGYGLAVTLFLGLAAAGFALTARSVHHTAASLLLAVVSVLGIAVGVAALTSFW